jgi:tetratricopeptide (TPR) repeat protein
MYPDLPSMLETIERLEAALCDSGSSRDVAPLAEAYRIAGRLDDALRTAERGRESFPAHVSICVVLARILTDLNDFEGARDAYLRVLKLDPDNLEALSLAGPAARTDAGEAPGENRKTEERGDQPSMEERAGGRPAAASLSEELAQLDDLFVTPSGRSSPQPDGGEPIGIATLTLAEIYSRQGLKTEAVRICETILERQPDNQEVRQALDEYLRQKASL